MIRRFRIRLYVSFVLCAGLLQCRSLLAQPVSNPAQDAMAVRQAGKDYVAALEKGDAKALAEAWTADGSYTDAAGHTAKIRDLLAKQPAGKVAPRPQVDVSGVTLRFLSADVALEEGDCELKGAAGSAPMKGRFMATWVRQNGRWKIDSLREAKAEPTPAADPLASLQMFVGEWAGEMNQKPVKVSAKWSPNKKFLERELTIGGDPQTAAGGKQEIGWDPRSQQIKSWFFNEDGGHGEGLWSKEGGVWVVVSSRVLPDGKLATSTQIYKFRDRDTLVWKSTRAAIDQQPVADFEVVLKRTK